MMSSPTARSLEWLRKNGWTADKVEQWIPKVKIRRDLFGFGDIFAFKQGCPHLIVQATADDGGHVSDRVKKIVKEPRAKGWLESGGEVVVHGWGKKGPRGSRKLWTLRSVAVTLDMT
jgi:hypothetical protein